MNIRQQLNNSFFALFIAALLIGAKDLKKEEDVWNVVNLPFCIFFLFLFFFRLKIYFDDNYNLSKEGGSAKHKDFILGYIATVVSWIFFPIAAYRLWDNIRVSYIFLLIAILACSIWTILAAFYGDDIQRKKKNRRWLWMNALYISLLTIMILNEWFLKLLFIETFEIISYNISIISNLILIILMVFDYKKSQTLENIRQD